MARLARAAAAGMPHHVIQRGNRRQGEVYGLKVWSYCLMDNHVHLIVVPEEEGSLAQAIGGIHKRYTQRINFREKWRRYLWEGKAQSFPPRNSLIYKGR